MAGPGRQVGRRRPVPIHRPAPAVAVVVLAAALAAGCGEGTGPPGASPGRMERLSATVDSVSIGDTLGRPLRVRVVSDGGSPVPGVDVRFRVVGDGPGRVEPGVSASGGDGIARTRFVAGDRIGSTTVRGGLPSHPDVEAVRFTIRTVVPQRTRMFTQSGDGQRAERGSQLPRPLVVRVTTRDSVPAGGVPVFWRVVSEAGEGARLTGDTTYTDTDGTARSLLTLGDRQGSYRVAARSRGADSAVFFSATALDSLDGDIRLDSLAPRPVRAGEPVTLIGSGFPTAGDGRVWVGGQEARILESSPDRLRVRIPAFADRCLPARSVSVRVVAGERQSNGRVARLRPAGPTLELEVGGSRVIGAEAGVDCLRFDAHSTARLYRIGIQSASRTAAVTPVRLVGRSGSDIGAGRATGDVSTLRLERAARTGRRPGIGYGPSAAELRIRSGAREALRRAGARPADRTAAAAETEGTGVRATSRTSSSVRPGDRRTFLLSVRPSDLQIDCRDTTAVVDAVARAVGDDVVLYEDTASPARGFTDANYRQLRNEFENVVFPVDTTYFGPPADIDGNGRVAVVFTPEVNELSPPGSEAFVGGFFLPTDLAESGDGAGSGSDAAGVCAVSNEAEAIYLPVPDPLGTVGVAVDRERALRNARSVTAHELQHLLSAEQRVFRTPVAQGENPFNDLESAWLSEGLAHLAEEVAGLALAGLAERSRLGFEEAVEDTRAFNAFHLNNFARARLFLRNPNESPALAADDPGGTLSLEMRGFGWLLARFLGDQVGPAGSSGPLGGSSEHRLFRQLSRGGDERATGVENVLRAARRFGEGSRTWEGLLGDFGVAVAAGQDTVPVEAGRRFRTWNIGDVYAGLHRNLPGDFREGYPLRSVPLDFETTAVAFDLNRSTAAYVRLRSGLASAAYSIRLESPAGSALPSSSRPQILVVRVR